MKNNWEIKTLREVLKLEYGKPLPESDRKIDGRFPAFGANGIKTRTDRFYCERPSIIVGRKGSAGEVTLVDGKFWPLDVTYFVTFDDTKFNLKFLFLLLKGLHLSSYATGVKPGINRNEIYNIKVKVPPLVEQKQIVKILDNKFATIEGLKKVTIQQINDVKELFESRLRAIFSSNASWFSDTLGNSLRLKSGDNLTTKDMVQGEIPVFGGNGIMGYHNLYNLSGNSVVIGRVGALCGVARNIEGDIWITDNAFKVVDKKYDFDNKFLTYMLNFHNLRKFAKQAAQPVISNSSLKNIKLLFPSINDQRQIAKELDVLSEKTKELEAIFRRKIADLEELKKSYLEHAFSGKL